MQGQRPSQHTLLVQKTVPRCVLSLLMEFFSIHWWVFSILPNNPLRFIGMFLFLLLRLDRRFHVIQTHCPSLRLIRPSRPHGLTNHRSLGISNLYTSTKSIWASMLGTNLLAAMDWNGWETFATSSSHHLSRKIMSSSVVIRSGSVPSSRRSCHTRRTMWERRRRSSIVELLDSSWSRLRSHLDQHFTW